MTHKSKSKVKFPVIISVLHIVIVMEYLDPPTCRKLGVWGLSKYSFSNMFWPICVTIISEHSGLLNKYFLTSTSKFFLSRGDLFVRKNFHLRQLVYPSFEQKCNSEIHLHFVNKKLHLIWIHLKSNVMSPYYKIIKL